MLWALETDPFIHDWHSSPRMIGAALLRIAAYGAMLAGLLAMAHIVGDALHAGRNHPLVLAPFFLTPLVFAWFMPGWRWLSSYVLLIVFVFLGGMALSGMPGGAGIAPAMFAVAVPSGAGAGFLAGVIGRGVGLALLHARRSPLTVWSVQIALALLFAVAAALAPLAMS